MTFGIYEMWAIFALAAGGISLYFSLIATYWLFSECRPPNLKTLWQVTTVICLNITTAVLFFVAISFWIEAFK